MMGKSKVLLLPSLSECTAFCSAPRYSHHSSHRSNPTILSGHPGKDLGKPQGVDHPEIHLHW